MQKIGKEKARRNGPNIPVSKTRSEEQMRDGESVQMMLLGNSSGLGLLPSQLKFTVRELQLCFLEVWGVGLYGVAVGESRLSGSDCHLQRCPSNATLGIANTPVEAFRDLNRDGIHLENVQVADDIAPCLQGDAELLLKPPWRRFGFLLFGHVALGKRDLPTQVVKKWQWGFLAPLWFTWLQTHGTNSCKGYRQAVSTKSIALLLRLEPGMTTIV